MVIANGVGAEYYALSKIMNGRKIGTFFSLAEETGPSVEEQAEEGNDNQNDGNGDDDDGGDDDGEDDNDNDGDDGDDDDGVGLV